jgi:hypothetical protein
MVFLAAVGDGAVLQRFLIIPGGPAEEPDNSVSTAGKMLEPFDMHKGGKEYWLQIAAFERAFDATHFLLKLTDSTGRPRSFFTHVSTLLQIWCNRRAGSSAFGEFENAIVLSDELLQKTR